MSAMDSLGKKYKVKRSVVRGLVRKAEKMPGASVAEKEGK
jgi:hypothetical protein